MAPRLDWAWSRSELQWGFQKTWAASIKVWKPLKSPRPAFEQLSMEHHGKRALGLSKPLPTKAAPFDLEGGARIADQNIMDPTLSGSLCTVPPFRMSGAGDQKVEALDQIGKRLAGSRLWWTLRLWRTLLAARVGWEPGGG